VADLQRVYNPYLLLSPVTAIVCAFVFMIVLNICAGVLTFICLVRTHY
jgi:hypothetical protein